MMNKEILKRFIDECWDDWASQPDHKPLESQVEAQYEKPTADTPTNETRPAPVEPPEDPNKNQNPDLRVVRTPSSGDKVYLLNDKDMTRRWITSPEVLSGLGFGFTDVKNIPDAEFTKYKPTTVATS